MLGHEQERGRLVYIPNVVSRALTLSKLSPKPLLDSVIIRQGQQKAYISSTRSLLKRNEYRFGFGQRCPHCLQVKRKAKADLI